MFKKKQKKTIKPVARGLYAWNALHAGSFLLFVEEQKLCYRFMFLPGPSDYYLTPEDFNKCCATNLLELVEPVPVEIFEESMKMLPCP